MRRRTRILATVGPALLGPGRLVAALRAGLDGIRLNFSHGTHEEHAAWVERGREAARRVGRPLAIVQDLAGPKLRTGRLAGRQPVHLRRGMRFDLTSRSRLGDADGVHVSYPKLEKDLRPGDRVLLSDGLIALRVVRAGAAGVQCRVEDGGILPERQSVHFPGSKLTVTSPTRKDLTDLRWGLSLGVDFVALSFVHDGGCIRSLRRAMVRAGKQVPIIAKIETLQGMQALDEILGEADGVMVARGDLGVELPMEEVPFHQKRIIREADRRGRWVITATQMLASMTENTLPTRAEVADVANAVLDGTDCVMLSGETAIGAYPIEAIEMMDRVAREAEAHLPAQGRDLGDGPDSDMAPAAVWAAVRLASRISADRIVVFTRTGRTALLVSKHQPSMPVIAFTSEPATLPRLALCWGVMPLSLPECSTADEMVRCAERRLRDARQLRSGHIVVFVGGSALTRAAEHMVKVHRVS